MAGIKHIPFLVTIAVVLIDRTHGGYYTDLNKGLSLPSEINNLPSDYIASSDASQVQELQENSLNHNEAYGAQGEEIAKTQYVIEHSGEPVQVSHVNSQQEESITQPIGNQFYKTEHFYLNPVPAVANNVQNVEPVPSLLYAHGQQLINQNIPLYPYAYQNQLNYNIPAYNIVPQQNQQVILQSDPLQIAGLQAVVPTSYATSLNVVQDTQENVVQTLPLNAIQSQDENQILAENNVQNDLSSILNIPVTGQQSNEQSDLTSIGTQESQPENVEQKPIEPIVTKDIYFHVPPPDIEESPAPVLPVSPKKTYKIIFIKLPSQERKNALQNIYNNYALTEDKTLIYVLVKNQEEQQVVVPQPLPSKPSEHEVIFVKYKTNKASSETTHNEEEQNVDDSLLLKPGLVNGEWK